MRYQIANDFPHPIMYEKAGPFVSLYMPTHRYSPLNEKDPIVFKNLLQQIEKVLVPKYGKNIARTMMEVFNQILGDKDFWMHTRDGLAILANLDSCIVYQLQAPVAERIAVADTLLVKPLIAYYQTLDEYYLLGLSRHDFTIYKGNRYGLEEIDLGPGTPRTITAVLGEETGERQVTHGSYAGTASPAIYHGYGSKEDEIAKDTERFFRYVDDFVLEKYTKPSRIPLILASVNEHHAAFRNISRNTCLMESGIRDSHDSLAPEKLRDKAWSIMEADINRKNRELVASCISAMASSKGSDDIKAVGQAVLENRVAKILIAADLIIPGKINLDALQIEVSEQPEITDYDLTDALAQIVMQNGGEVFIMPESSMPSNTGIAAIYRY